MRPLPNTRSCFVCGSANPIGLRLHFHTDGGLVEARFTPRPEHVGFKGVVHGGLLATVLDELMVWACAVATGRFAFCAELNVRFVRSIAPGMEVTLRGRLTANRKNRLFEARSEALLADGREAARATGKYMPIPESETRQILADLADGAGWFSIPQAPGNRISSAVGDA